MTGVMSLLDISSDTGRAKVNHTNLDSQVEADSESINDVSVSRFPQSLKT